MFGLHNFRLQSRPWNYGQLINIEMAYCCLDRTLSFSCFYHSIRHILADKSLRLSNPIIYATHLFVYLMLEQDSTYDLLYAFLKDT